MTDTDREHRDQKRADTGLPPLPAYVPGPEYAECIRPGCPAFHHQWGDKLYFHRSGAPAGVHHVPKQAPTICTTGAAPEDRDWYTRAEPGGNVRLDRPCPDCGHIILMHAGAWNPALNACLICELEAVRDAR